MKLKEGAESAAIVVGEVNEVVELYEISDSVILLTGIELSDHVSEVSSTKLRVHSVLCKSLWVHINSEPRYEPNH